MGLRATYVLHLLPLFLNQTEVEHVWSKVRQGFTIRQALKSSEKVQFLLNCSLEELELLSKNLDRSSQELLEEAIKLVSKEVVYRLD